MLRDDHQDVCDVTVIMPAYRAAATIGRALASVAAQTLKPYAVVVVDDGSDDDTYTAAEAMAPSMNGVVLRVLRQDNAGPGAARNRGLANCSTEFVAFLDADDEWLPDKLAETIRRFDRPELAFVSHSYVRVDGSRETRIDCTRHFPSVGDRYLALFRRNFIDTSTVVARRRAVAAAGGFDDSLPSAQDYQLWLAMAEKPGAEFLVFPDALSRYHITALSVSSDIEGRRRCATRILLGQLPKLHARTRRPTVDALARTVLICGEAVKMYLAARRPGAALFSLLRLPVELVRVGWTLRRIERSMVGAHNPAAGRE